MKSTTFKTINGTTVFYARNVRKAFIQQRKLGPVRVAEVNGLTGEIYSIMPRKTFKPNFRAYVRKCWSGQFTPLQFEFTR